MTWFVLVLFGLIVLVKGCCAVTTNNDAKKVLQKLDALEKRINNAENENNVLKDVLSRMSNTEKTALIKPSFGLTHSKQTVTFESLRKRVIGNTFNQNKEANQKRISHEYTQVAFWAGLSQRTLYPSSHQVIKYDHILINEGNGYNSKRGLFIAPVSGIYLVSAKIAEDGKGNSVALELVKNGKPVIGLYATVGNGYFATETQTLPLQLNKDDFLWMRIYDGYQGHYLDGDTNYYNSFSAILITAT